MSKRILINGKGKYVGDNVASHLSSKKPKSTLQVLDEDEEVTNDGEKFKVSRTSPDTPREDVLSMALESDYIIWDVSDMSNTSDNFGSVSDANWLIENLGKVSDTFDEAKQFILISTVATWARSKPKDPEDPDVPFDESDYRVRRSHVSFKEHLALEKAVVKAGKTYKGKLVCYVVASGIQYGNGESTFHYMFKQPWLDVDEEVCIYGNGKNRLPMIHVTDLAQIITNVVDRRPQPKYIVAVDQGIHTYQQIVKAVVNNIGNGRIKKIRDPQAINTEEDISSAEADLLQVNLTFEQSELLQDTFQMEWKSEQGIIENIEEIVSQYRNSRKLKPVKMVILAPPQAGKTALAKKLALEYKLHIIKAENIISNTVEILQDIIARSQTVNENADDEEEEGDEEDDTALEEARELLNEIQENLESANARVEDELFCKIFLYHLTSKKCRNQGFILDGFPKTFEQAKILFDSAVEDEEEGDSGDNQTSNLPEMVVSLTADDEWLKTRVMHLDEADIQGTHNDEENFLRRLKTYRENNAEDLSPLTFFDQNEIHPTEYVLDGQVDPKIINTSYGADKWPLGDEPSSTDGTFSSILNHIREIIGAPRNYGLTSAEEAEIKVIFEQRKLKADKEAKEKLQKQVEEEERKQKENMKIWAEQLEEVHRQEAERFEASSMELRNYLMKYVMPTLTKAVHETTKVKPEDPVDFIAEYLFKHNPQYD